MTLQEFVQESGSFRHTYKVTPDIYYAFQRVSGDYNPLHTDVDFSKDRGFDDCVMYGNILNAFVSHFVGMLLPSKKVMIQSQDISYHKPVYMNDEIQLLARIDTFSEAVSAICFKLKFVRIKEGTSEVIAKGHVQIGLLNR